MAFAEYLFRSSASVLVLLVGHGTQDGLNIAFSTTSVACFLSAIFSLHTAGVPSHLSTMGDIVARSVIEGHRSRLVNRLHSGLAISTAQTVAPYLCFMFILGCLDGLLH